MYVTCNLEMFMFWQREKCILQYCLDLDKRGIQKEYSYFSVKTYAVGTHEKCRREAFLMSTHNKYLFGEKRKVLYST